MASHLRSQIAPFVVSLLASAACLAGCADKAKPTSDPSQSSAVPVSSAPGAAPSGGASPAIGAAPGEVAVGKPAPEFAVKAADGVELSLAKLKGKPVVLYFYPKDETPGCTKEACAFRDAWQELSKSGVVLIGVSTDSDESHKAFAEHHKLPFHLVSDAKGALAKAYGVPNRAGFLGRQSFVIGKDGAVKKVYRDVDVTAHAGQIKADLADGL